MGDGAVLSNLALAKKVVCLFVCVVFLHPFFMLINSSAIVGFPAGCPLNVFELCSVLSPEPSHCFR